MTVIVEAGPFNGPDDADSVMNWVDITGYVNDNLQAPTTSVGRQTELQQVDPGSLTLVLNNPDHRFTPGNTSSPYYPGWRTSMRLRLRETIGYESFTHFDGNMLQPELVIQTPGVDQTVTVSATDRLGRLQTSRKFISTLAEYIIYNGGSTLKAYYPLGESQAPFRDAVGGQPTITVYSSPSSLAATNGLAAFIAPGQGTPPQGDDLRGILFTPSSVPSGDVNRLVNSWALIANFQKSKSPISVGAGVPLTVVFWIKMSDTWTEQQFLLLGGMRDATGLNAPQLNLNRNDLSALTTNFGYWSGYVNDPVSGYFGQTLGTFDRGGQLMPIALQWTYSPNNLNLWIDTQQFTVTPAGTLTAPVKLSDNFFVGPIAGELSHFQIYVGTYTRAQFLAQRSAGFDGLASQYTGQRITTIAQYAGMASGDMDIDPGTSRMQRATLASRSPLDVMQEAAKTEQGILHAAGRRLLFHDRLRRYNR